MLLAVSLAGCGESQQAKAEKTVCSAKSAIQAKVDSLQTVVPSLTTLPQIKSGVSAIVAEVKKIQGAQADLNPGRRKQVQAATSEFEQKVTSTLSHIAPSFQFASVEAELKAAVKALASSYAQALAPVQCS